MKKIFVSSLISDEIKCSLEKYGFYTILLPPYKKLSDAVNCHCDMLIFPYENGKILTYREYYENNSDLFENNGVEVITTDHKVESRYPYDIGLNALAIGKKLFCNEKYTCSEIKRMYSDIVNVKQGYTRCSCCTITDRAVITSDEGLAEKISPVIECITIKSGEVELKPYSYGFIGGASFYHDDTLYFFGNIENHNSSGIIKDKCREYGVRIISLGKDKLTDYGGAIVIR